MIDLIEMMRPLNCVMACIGVLVGGLIVTGSNIQVLFSTPFILAVISVFLITGAGNMFNDYVDVEADKINAPHRPIPSGKISKNTAFVFSIGLFVTGVFFTAFINWVCFLIALFNTFLLIIYSLILQDKVLVGNLAVGYLTGSLFLFGGAALGDITLPSVLFLLATLTTITREIVKDLEDMEGDRRSFLKKIVTKFTSSIAERFKITTDGVKMKYRERTMVTLAISSLILAVMFSILPYYYGILGIGYLVIVLVADVIFVSCMYSLGKEMGNRKGYHRISRRLKIGMFVALIAFIAGVLI